MIRYFSFFKGRLLHVCTIYLHLAKKNMVNVGRYSSPMQQHLEHIFFETFLPAAMGRNDPVLLIVIHIGLGTEFP